MTPDDLDGSALPAIPTPETLRLALIYMQRDIRQIRADVAENGRLDDDDRQKLAALDERTERMIAIMDRKPLDQITDAFSKLFGLGDNARRPWAWVLLLALVVLGALIWYARDTWVNPEVRSERIEASRVKARADSLREARAYELELRRLSQPSTIITVPGGTVVRDSATEQPATPVDTDMP